MGDVTCLAPERRQNRGLAVLTYNRVARVQGERAKSTPKLGTVNPNVLQIDVFMFLFSFTDAFAELSNYTKYEQFTLLFTANILI